MLEIYHNASRHSFELEDYTTDSVSVDFSLSGEIHIGYYKPINALFVEITALTHVASLDVEYFNGSSFVSVSNLHNSTKNLQRSGFIHWDRNQDDEQETTLNSKELFWYKIKLTGATPTIVFKGINLNFSNDNDLKEEYPNIMDHLPDGETSFVGFHQAARKDIITYFRNQGKLVRGLNPKKLDQFDLLDFTEVREASKFLTLSKIFSWLSDGVDDKWYQKSRDFVGKYGDKINLFYLSFDQDDDGKESANEKNGIKSVSIIRL